MSIYLIKYHEEIVDRANPGQHLIKDHDEYVESSSTPDVYAYGKDVAERNGYIYQYCTPLHVTRITCNHIKEGL